jgi:hypothetical protein
LPGVLGLFDYLWERELDRIDGVIGSELDYTDVVFKEVIEQRNEELGRFANNVNMQALEVDYGNDLAETCGQPIAKNYQRRICHAIRSLQRKDSRLYEYVLDMANLSSNLVKDIAPLLTSFVIDVLQKCRTLGIERLVVFDRDADIFYVIAKILGESFFGELDIILAPINRKLFGIADRVGLDGKDYSELVKRSVEKVTQNSVLTTYLTSTLGERGCYAVLDTGLYGSIPGVLNYLHEVQGILPKPYVFYFSSRNPHIYGFVNQYLTMLPIPVNDWPCWLELFTDTVETLAKTHGPVEPTFTESRILLPTRSVSCLYEASSWGIIVGIQNYVVHQAAKEWNKVLHPEKLMKDLYVCFQKVSDSPFMPSFCLERHAPPSPYGPAILRGWNQGSLPPLAFEAIKPGIKPLCKCYRR